MAGASTTASGRRKTLSLGTYPDTSLKLARQKADEYRKLVAEGTDPSDTRKATKTQQRQRAGRQRIAADRQLRSPWRANGSRRSTRPPSAPRTPRAR